MFFPMLKKPMILLTPGIQKRGVEFHDTSVSLSVRYELAVARAGGLSVTAPATTDRALLAQLVARSDGLMLTGGDDIAPELYESDLPVAIRTTVSCTPDGGRRDLRELILIEEVFHQRKPLLAICRGHQLLNVALGGKLYADIRRQVPGALNHRRLDRADEIVHEVPLTAGSLLARITDKRVLGVNSSHHQAVVKPAEPFMATAFAWDGIIEAMELKPEAARLLPFLLSVQFHPERLADRHAGHQAIFANFVAACARKPKK